MHTFLQQNALRHHYKMPEQLCSPTDISTTSSFPITNILQIFVISPIILSQTLVPANRVYMLYITYPWALRATVNTLGARKPLPYPSEWALTGTKV